MGDVVGRLFREFAVTLGVAILFSAAVSLTLTPMPLKTSRISAPRLTVVGGLAGMADGRGAGGRGGLARTKKPDFGRASSRPRRSRAMRDPRK